MDCFRETLLASLLYFMDGESTLSIFGHLLKSFTNIYSGKWKYHDCSLPDFHFYVLIQSSLPLDVSVDRTQSKACELTLFTGEVTATALDTVAGGWSNLADVQAW